jgi:hypothetical protein
VRRYFLTLRFVVFPQMLNTAGGPRSTVPSPTRVKRSLASGPIYPFAGERSGPAGDLRRAIDEIGAVKLLEYNPAATLSVPQVIEYYNNVFKAMFDQMNLIRGSREFIQKAYKASN